MLPKNLLNNLQVTIKPTNGNHEQERLGNYYSKKAIFALLNERHCTILLQNNQQKYAKNHK